MTLSNLVNRINIYEAGLYKHLRTGWNKTRFKPQTREELRTATVNWMIYDNNIINMIESTSKISRKYVSKEIINLLEKEYELGLPEYGHISLWDVSKITDMRHLFYLDCGNNYFNRNLRYWDTSNVTNMRQMFIDSYSFNTSLAEWDTSNVTNMRGMFSGCTEFNQSLNNWDTSNVTNMAEMFYFCDYFNQPLNKWDTSNMTDMDSMFSRCYKFDQDISSWNVSKVTKTNNIFIHCPIKVNNQPKFNYGF